MFCLIPGVPNTEICSQCDMMIEEAASEYSNELQLVGFEIIEDDSEHRREQALWSYDSDDDESDDESDEEGQEIIIIEGFPKRVRREGEE